MTIAIILRGVIDDWAKYGVERQIHEAKLNNQTILPIFIDSPGGSVYKMRSIIDLLKASNMVLVTICTGMAMSAASVIYSLGSKRYSYPSASFMLHEARRMPCGDFVEKGSDLKAVGEQLDKITEQSYQILDSQSGKKAGYFKELIYSKGNIDLYLSPIEAMSHGLVTDIKVPEYSDIFPIPTDTRGNTRDEFNLISLFEENIKKMDSKKKEFESIIMQSNSELPESFETIKENFNLTEEIPKMAQNLNPDGTPKTPSVANSIDFQGMISQALEAQRKSMEDVFQQKYLDIQQNAEKKADEKWSTQFDALNQHLGTISGERISEKKANDLVSMRSWLKQMHQVENKITLVEMSEMEAYMLEHTSTENGSRQAYIAQQEKRPKLSSLNQQIPDQINLDFVLSYSDKKLLEDNPHMKSDIINNAKRKHIAEKNGLSIFKRQDKAKIDQLVAQLG